MRWCYIAVDCAETELQTARNGASKIVKSDSFIFANSTTNAGKWTQNFNIALRIPNAAGATGRVARRTRLGDDGKPEIDYGVCVLRFP